MEIQKVLQGQKLKNLVLFLVVQGILIGGGFAVFAVVSFDRAIRPDAYSASETAPAGTQTACSRHGSSTLWLADGLECRSSWRSFVSPSPVRRAHRRANPLLLASLAGD